MEYEIDFDDRPADVVLRTSGGAAPAVFERMIRELVGHERFRPGMYILVDHTDLDLGTLTGDDVRRVADTTRSVSDALQAAYLVVVAPTTIGFGLSRMWQTMVDDLEIEATVALSREDGETRVRARRAAS